MSSTSRPDPGRKRPLTSTQTWFVRQQVALALVLVVGGALSVAVFLGLQAWEHERETFVFQQHAGELISRLERTLASDEEVIDSIAGLYGADESVSRQEFREFVADALARHPGIQALEWVPRVPLSGRAAYEEAARAGGLPDFQFTERDSQGRLVPAGQRAEYFPVYYVEPLAGNEAALGFDVASNPVRREALERARDTGEAAATGRVVLVQETGDQYGFLLFMAIYRRDAPHDTLEQRRENLSGFALGVFRVGEMVEKSLAGAQGSEYSVHLSDQSAPAEESPLYESHPGPAVEPTDPGFRRSGAVVVDGRTWSIMVHPTSHSEIGRQPWIALGALAVGLMATLALAAHLYTALGRAAWLARVNAELEHEICERKRMEEQLLRAQRLETAGKFAAQVAHDFNNLLGPLVGYPELIKMQLPYGHSATRFCDAMLEAALRMATINENMMAITRVGLMDRKLIRLQELVPRVVADLAKAPPSLKVQMELATDLPPVKGSPAGLVKLLSNLITNAREAMHDDGVLAVRVERVRVEQPFYGYEQVEAGDYVRLSVSNTGPAIPPEIRDRIFDAFFTTRKSDQKRGSGLGLTVVHTVVKDHGGYIDLHSEEGEGTTFSVYLPVPEQPGCCSA